MKRLKIRTQTMFGTSHSWSITMQEIMIQFAKMGHDLYISSTDGYQNLSHDLSTFYNRDCDDPDIDICYTLPLNWKSRFKKKSKLKLSIFNVSNLSNHFFIIWILILLNLWFLDTWINLKNPLYVKNNSFLYLLH